MKHILLVVFALLLSVPVSADNRGIKLFQHCDYDGYSSYLAPGAYHLSDLTRLGLLNDDLSSVEIPHGYYAIMYEHDNFSGRSWIFDRNQRCFVRDGLNDIVSSVIVAESIGLQKSRSPRPSDGVTVFKHCDYGGYSALLEPGGYSLADLQRRGVVNDDLSAIKVPKGYEAILYEHDNYRGRYWTVNGDDRCFVNNNFNDVVSSIIVRCTECP